MVALADLLAADPNIWREQARAWTQLGQNLDDRAADLQRQAAVLREAWRGTDADAAVTHTGRLTDVWRKRSSTLQEIGRVLGDHADRIDTARRRASALVVDSLPTYLIQHDGSIIIDPIEAIRAQQLPGEPFRLQQGSERLAAELREVLDAATMTDDATVRALQVSTADAAVLSGALAGMGVAAPVLPPAITSPAGVRQWWSGLSDAQRESLLTTDAGRIGGLDGVPAVDRDRANRIELAAAHAQIDNQRDDLLRRLPAGSERDTALAAVEAKARGLTALEQRLNAPTGPHAYLLGLNSADTGRVVVAIGNPDTATNVVTYVPGTGAGLGGAPGDVQRAEAMVEAARIADPTASTAAITWVGYHAPQEIFNLMPGTSDVATDPAYATDAEPALNRFQDGLRATHDGAAASHNTVLGHSYGSTVVGFTARDQGLNADDLVFVGSPGVGTDTASALGHDPHHVWSSYIGNDPIKYAVGSDEAQLAIGLDPSPGGTDLVFGLQPTDAGFGGEDFASQAGSPGFEAHSQYWDRQSTSLTNIARIATGHYDQVTR